MGTRGTQSWGPGWLGRTDLIVLLAAGALALAAWAFLTIAGAVTEGEFGHLDERILRSLRQPEDVTDPLGPKWVEEAARDVTALGGHAVLTLLVGAVVGYQLITRRRHAAVLVLVATIGGALLSSTLKEIYARPRPDLVPHLAHVSTSSFPSGHSMLSAVVYLTLGALLARLTEEWWVRVYCVTAAVLLTLIVGVSRVYLGVHYPTDVAAGWAAGLGWAVACWLVARSLQRRGTVEGDAA